MILTCEHCGTRYQLDENLIQPEGSKVRCSNCKRLWTVWPPGTTPEAAFDAPMDAVEPESEAPGLAAAAGLGAALVASAEEAPEADEQQPGLEDLNIAGLGLNEFSEEEILQTDDLSFDELEHMLDEDVALPSDETAAPTDEGISDSGLALSELEEALGDADAVTPGLESEPDELSLEELERMLEAEGGLVDGLDLEANAPESGEAIDESTTEAQISLAELAADDGMENEGFEAREEQELIFDLPDISDDADDADDADETAAGLEIEDHAAASDETMDFDPMLVDTAFDPEDTGVEDLDLTDLEQLPSPASDAAPDDDEEAEYIDLDLVGEEVASDVAAADLFAETAETIDSVDAEDLLAESEEPGDSADTAEDFAFELEPETVPGPAGTLSTDTVDTAADSEAAEGLEVAPELQDLLGDMPPDIDIEETEEIEVEDLSADLLGEAPEAAEPPKEDMDFTLELSPEIEEIFGEIKNEDAVVEETEELDLSAITSGLDAPESQPTANAEAFELDLDLISEGDDADADPKSDLSPSEGDDLSDLRLELEPAEDETRELDLSLIEEVLEQGDSSPSAAGETEPGEMDLELNLDLDDAAEDIPQSPTGQIGDPETQELDLSALESMLGDETADAGDEKAPVEEPLEPPDMELELDALADEVEAADDGDDDATRELDFADIERMLEQQPERPVVPEADDGGELELDLELELEADETTDAAGESGESSKEIDLTEIERLLDVEDTTDKTLAPREDIEDLELDLDLSSSVDDDTDLDLNFDIHDDEDEEPSTLFDTSESDEMGLDLELDVDETEASREGIGEDDLDLEFEVLEEAGETQAATAAAGVVGAAAAAAAKADDLDLSPHLEAEQPKPAKPAPTRKPVPPAPVRTRRSRVPLLLLLIAILGGGGYYVTQYTDIQIPYVSEWLGAQAEGAVAPVDASLKGYFVENTPEGQLYVIEGRVRNDSRSQASFIEVTGRVFANGKQFQRASKAYCGNVIPRGDLQSLTLADIQKQLGNRQGTDGSNVRLANGAEVPFMIVFGNLPQQIQLEEFTVEVSNSIAVN